MNDPNRLASRDTDIVKVPTSSSKWKVGFPSWPDWGQNVDWTSDGQPDENAKNNCLPESLAECIKYITKVELSADLIKDIEYGEAYTGFTDFNHSTDFLKRYCELDSYQWSYDTNNQTLWEVWHALDKGFPIIGLFQYGGVPSGTHHCMPYVYLDEHTVTLSDPWIGMRRNFDYKTHEAWSLFAGLTIPRKRYV